MSDFQIVIFDGNKRTDENNHADTPNDTNFITQDSAGNMITKTIDDLAEIWAEIVSNLETLAEKTEPALKSSPIELDTISFNLGISAGFKVILVSEGTASISISFKKTQQPGTGDQAA